MAQFPGNQLLVEGRKDKRLIPYLMEENGVDWPKDRIPVQIDTLDSDTLPRDEISVFLKQPKLASIGVVLDADDDAISKWNSARQRFSEWFSDIPATPLATGFISNTNASDIRLGIWIMPDNSSRGMLETFLAFLVKPTDQGRSQFARDARDRAKSDFNAPFKLVHLDKAHIHTFLAWQDEPGLQLHEAISHKVLDPTSAYSAPFVSWFRNLFAL